MHCFGRSTPQRSTRERGRGRGSSTSPPHPRRSTAVSDQSPASSGGTQTSTAASPTTTTINLRQEYAQAVHTNSYNEIWSTIFHPGPVVGLQHQQEQEQQQLIDRVLQPDRASIQEALRTAPPTHLTRLASRYFDRSEHTSHLCLALHLSVDRARSLYAPISDLLDLLPHHLHRLSPAQCDWVFDTLLDFHRTDNPFPSPTAFDAFRTMQRCFAELRQQLDLRLHQARRRRRVLRCATRVPATCLVASAAGLAVTALAIATHALAALVAGPAFLLGLPQPRDLLAGPRRRLQEHMAQLDAAARGAYVLNNDLGTIEQLVARLHATVESDRALVRLGVERGRGQRHLIEEVLRHLRSNHPNFIHQLRDLDEHVCLCFAAVNRARSLLLHHIHNRNSS